MQLHKRFTTEQAKRILEKYLAKEIKAKEAMGYFNLGHSRFYDLVNDYKKDPKNFILSYNRQNSNNRINPVIEKNIFKELQIEKEKIIDNPNVPTKKYNYSYIGDLLKDKYNQSVSVPTIINRAKNKGYWKPKPPKKIHDREVITNYIGELIQHDASHHLWAPDAKEKWVLITSLDDYSRAILYADFWRKESTWAHISASQSLILKHGFPFSYYVDQLRIFRYIKHQDRITPWTTYTKFTDEVNPQWKQVMEKDCQVKVIYALSAQAKGKVERPYEWLQDRVVRTCVRESITDIKEAKIILKDQIRKYNTKWVHSTTKEVPMKRFQNATENKQSLFRPFEIKPPFESVKDIFCLRIKRIVNPYRKISLGGFVLRVPDVMPRQEVELRIYPNVKTGVSEVRFWHQDKFKGAQRVRNNDISIFRF